MTRLCGSLLMAAAPLFARTPPPPPDILAVAADFNEGRPQRTQKTGVTLKIFNTGLVVARAGAASSRRSWLSRVKLDELAFLIRHPEQGPILFDLGISSESARLLNSGALTRLFARFVTSPGQDILSQLKAENLRPEDVRWIILSHLHLDHTSHLDEFPNATVVVSRREWDGQKDVAARKKTKREFDPAAYERRLKLRLVDLDAAAPFGAFDHGKDLFDDGSVILVDLQGHTAGSMGAWVNLDGGPLLLAGDAAWVIDNFRDLALPVRRAIADFPRYWRTLHILRRMQEAAPRLVILPAHDLTPLTLSPRKSLSPQGRQPRQDGADADGNEDVVPAAQ